MCIQLTHLRKYGYHFRPFSGKIRVGIKWKIGILVDVTEKEEWLLDGLRINERNSAKPHLVMQLATLISGVEKQPQLIPLMEPFMENLQLAMINGRKQLREATHLQLEIKAK